MELYTVTNSGQNKGIIIKAKDVDDAFKLANKEFYAPYPTKNDLRTCQRFDINCQKYADGYQIHDKVQFQFTGSGSGVTTSYNCNIHIQPNERQIEFIGESEIEFIKFGTKKDI